MRREMNVTELQDGLRTKRFGKSILFVRAVRSTNDWAKQLAEFGAPEGTVAIADSQISGRGRLGRRWFSPVGGLWFSIILRPELRAGEVSRLVFVASLAVADALRETYKLCVETKWPNDVLVNGRKVCGILAEAKSEGEKVSFVVVGIGVNAGFRVRDKLPRGLWGIATSLEDEVDSRIEPELLFRTVLERFESFYQMLLEDGFVVLLDMWKRYAGFLGRMVEVNDGSEKVLGRAIDVGTDGSLSVRLQSGPTQRFFVGEVSLSSFS